MQCNAMLNEMANRVEMQSGTEDKVRGGKDFQQVREVIYESPSCSQLRTLLNAGHDIFSVDYTKLPYLCGWYNGRIPCHGKLVEKPPTLC